MTTRRLFAATLLASAMAATALAPLGARAKTPVAPAAAPAAATAPAAADPLPSWRAGPNKTAILAYVQAAATPGHPGFIPVEDRIATFDNDGTLWAEQPVVQLQFVESRVAAMAKADPTLATRVPAVKALLTRDMAYFSGPDAEAKAMPLMALAASGMTPTQYARQVSTFFATAKHPTLGVPYSGATYKPMVELLAYLRANGFETWITSGGGIDFMRPISQSFYGVPPEQVIGSTGTYDVTLQSGVLAVNKAAKIGEINDKTGKVVGILQHIGKIPVFAAGNERTGGDIAQLTYSQSSPYPTFQLLVNHDDAAREFAYSEPQGESLAAAKAANWHVVSIANDWGTVFTGDVKR